MGRELLGAVEFPLGNWSKQQVRAKAAELGMPNADAPDSQELCFVPGGDHGEVVEARARALGLPREQLEPGEIRDVHGRVLGEHRGIHRVTIGQRRGLGIAGERPRYVLRVLPDSRSVVVGDADELGRERIEIADFRRLADVCEQQPFAAQVQIRHRSEPTPARVELVGERAIVEFETPVRAVAPGQAAVVYQGERVVGGGWIR
jgi:tRNA-specific 2-thiouridylase